MALEGHTVFFLEIGEHQKIQELKRGIFGGKVVTKV